MLPSGTVNRDYKDNKLGPIVSATPSTAYWHPTNVAGIIANRSLHALPGVARDAKLLNARFNTTSGAIRALSDLTAYPVNPAGSGAPGAHAALGVGIISHANSLNIAHPGNNGTSIEALAADWIINKQDVVYVVASGNDGDSNKTGTGKVNTVNTIGDAYNVITVGAMDRTVTTAPSTPWFGKFLGVAPFSSRGLTGDLRSKPDLVAPGVRLRTAAPGSSSPSTSSTDPNRIDPSGTDYATAMVTGAAALMRQEAKKLLGGAERRAAASHHLTIKSSMLTGAGKLKGWDASHMSQPLDKDFGAGVLDVRTAMSLMKSDQKPGRVRGLGSYLGTTLATNSSKEFRLRGSGKLRKGNVIIATVTWDRTLTRTAVGTGTGPDDNPDNDLSNDTYKPDGKPPTNPLLARVRDINLELIQMNTALSENFVRDHSLSLNDNLEHIFYKVTKKQTQWDSSFTLKVSAPGNGVEEPGGPSLFPDEQKYSLTWRVAPNLMAARGSADLAEFAASMLDSALSEADPNTAVPTSPSIFSGFGSSPTGLAI